MNLKIKVNGTEIALESTSPVASLESLDATEASIATLSKEADDLSKAIGATALMADIKTVESFGYKSTEAVGQNVKEALSKFGVKVKEFLDKLIATIKNIIMKKIVEGQINAAAARLTSGKGQFDTVVVNARKFHDFNAKKSELLQEADKLDKSGIPNNLMGVYNAINTIKSVVGSKSLMGGDFKVTDENAVAEVSFDAMSKIVLNAKSAMNKDIDALKVSIKACETARKDLDKTNGDIDTVKKVAAVTKLMQKGIGAIITYTAAVANWKFKKPEAAPETK